MPRPPNADADATKSRILESAHHLFASHGVGSTSIRDVAKRAGVSLAMVHHYFGSKDGLYVACVDAMYAELAALRAELETAFLGATSVDDLLVRAITEAYGFARKHKDAVRLLMRTTVDAGELTPKGREFHLAFLAGGTTAIAALSGREPTSLRLPLQTLVFLVARYAVQNEGELLVVTGAPSIKDAHEAVVSHLTDAARGLLGPVRHS
jgi:AcrR family transcriptional regulator